MRRLDSRSEVIDGVKTAQLRHSTFDRAAHADDAAWTRGRLGRMQLPANDGMDAIGTHEKVSFGAATIRQMKRHASAALCEAGRFVAGGHHVDAGGVEQRAIERGPHRDDKGTAENA